MPYNMSKYVLHFHHKTKKTNPHFDLRIQIPNKSLLASFAIPKKYIPENPGEKVLVIRTQDHGNYWLYVDDMDIPDDQSGAGKIDMIDRGVFQINGWGDSFITFSSIKSGKYFNGDYVIIKIKGKKTTDGKNLWVLMKKKEKPE